MATIQRASFIKIKSCKAVIIQKTDAFWLCFHHFGYDCVYVENETTSISFKLTDEDIATLKSDGLRVSGYDITLTKIRSTSNPTGISNTIAPSKADNSVHYNLLGVKNGNGIYIMNGKKYMK